MSSVLSVIFLWFHQGKTYNWVRTYVFYSAAVRTDIPGPPYLAGGQNLKLSTDRDPGSSPAQPRQSSLVLHPLLLHP
jgi:hypothetical protein